MGLTRYERNRRFLDSLKSAPCHDCGLTFPPAVMDFDHVRGVKLADVSSLVNATRGALEEEVWKCEVVCATCHRLRTRRRQLDAHVDAAEAYDVLVSLHDE